MKRAFDGRDFQLWEYRVSHGHALVRGPRRNPGEPNQDVILAAVEYIGLPRHLPALALDDPSAAELATAAELLGRPVAREHVHVFVAAGRRYLTIAAQLVVRESDADIFDSPFED